MPIRPPDASISVLVLRVLMQGAAAAGLTWSQLVDAGAKTLGSLDPRLLADPDARVSVRAALELWELLPRLTQSDTFGLRLAEQAGATPAIVTLWFVLTSTTLDQGFDQMVRFQRLLHDRSYGELVRSARETTYVHRVGDAAFRAPRHAVEFGFAHLLHIVRRATDADVTPSSVRFQHAQPASLIEHERVFGNNVNFGADVDAITFDSATMALQVRTADLALDEILASHARTLVAAVPDSPTWSDRVRRAIGGGSILREANNLAAVATSFSMTKRSLQRRLRDEGTSFEDVVDGVRRSLAQRYLRERRIPIQETAFLLGYSDVPTFHRAFVRWTGVTPKTFRERSDP